MADSIDVRGARERNLRDVSVRIPKRAITVLTGVSGSGRSSLVFETIGAEAQWQLQEHLGLQVAGRPPLARRPDVDAVEHLAVAVVVDQERLVAAPEASVGMVMGIGSLLDRWFASTARPAAAPRVEGYSSADLAAMTVSDLVPVLRLMDGPAASSLLPTIIDRLRRVESIGLGHLSLDRLADTLSGGEAQRVKLVRHLGSDLEDVVYLLDEPSVGLHPHDLHRLCEVLVALRDKGNTLLIVEHDPAVIEIADHVVEMGPGSGPAGGRVIFEGTVGELRLSATPTGRHLDHARPSTGAVRAPTGWLPIRDARAHHLRAIDVDLPTGVLTVITGVAGSGKSSLVRTAFLPQHPEAIVIDQSAIDGSRGADPATWMGIVPHTRGGATAVDALLALTVDQALETNRDPAVADRLRAMADVGLGQVPLGRPLAALSGGERQRLKLADGLHRRGTLYVLDEPTTGLHPSDVARLLAILDRLVDGGATVIVIEHQLDVVRAADWVVDLGPESGTKGGRVVFTGTPEALLASPDSHTADALRRTAVADDPPVATDLDREVQEMLAILRGTD